MNQFFLSPRIISSTLVLITTQATAMTCHVAVNASGTGSSWATPMSLHSALADGNCDTIWVKRGTYYPTTDNNRNISFVIDRPLALYGGFAGTETKLNQRNVVNNPTNLSGNIGSAAINTDNSHHVVVIENSQNHITHTTTLDGIAVVDGYSTVEYGAGMYCVDSQTHVCAPTLRHMKFSNNRALGGAAIDGYTGNKDNMVDMFDVSFNNNYAEFRGGAIDFQMSYDDYHLYMEQVSFHHNEAGDNGGAIFNFISAIANGGPQNTISIIDADFIGNSSSAGGAIEASSRGVLTSSHWTFQNVKFSDNMASSWGGTIGHFAQQNGTSTMTFNGVEFIDNLSGFDGGVLNVYASFGAAAHLVINNSAFINNQAERDGGAINYAVLDQNSNLNITNTTFAGNTAGNDGGAIWSGVVEAGPEVTINNVTFYQNSAVEAGGAFYNYATPETSPTSAFTNTIIWGNTAPIGAQLHNHSNFAAATIDHSVIEGGCPLNSQCNDLIVADPLLGTTGYHGGPTQTAPLMMGSSAIDVADNNSCAATDQRGLDRPADGDGDGFSDCDIGAFEWVDLIFMNGFE